MLQAVLGCQTLVNDNNNGLNPQTKEDLQSRVSQAMQALQSVKKRLANNSKSVPSGGSYCSKTEQKIYDLLQAFGVDKRIRIGR
ncbi:MAG: hypothetical protein QOK51_01905 [Nitrososphaeraceae archaeon]|nr:hypothetical protein [Nitrososphaeraceae archaeon]MDW0239198.1 hypothetical protein [Nitrososphaeraceae archaeon]MDW0242678.1 hypothetical protein [Nitrososphaeraceae archaeon]MDW0259795.1 hypothetical protein [Nitrososphaeraceae archaeon]MDW0275741.1 hypothetical protein [Nitrososphaeraceae archaeon]